MAEDVRSLNLKANVMKQQIIYFIKRALQKLDISLVRHSALRDFAEGNSASSDIEILLSLPEDTALQRIRYFRQSKSQFRQDLFVLSQLKFKRNGFFVEFGATNGIDLSNTFLLEREFGWSGILAEPAKCWHQELTMNRRCHIETDCVWKDSQSELEFNEVDTAELSTINRYSDHDLYKRNRKSGKTYTVRTISLNDLLSKYAAPRVIDYLSIDTEGSEYEILSNFDFSRHTFGVITCEHNYTAMREKIFKLLTDNGYVRVLEELSMVDDWYVWRAQ